MSGQLGVAALFGIFAAFLLWAAKKCNFFQLPSSKWDVQLKLQHVLAVFAIYFIGSFLLSGIAVSFFQREIALNYMKAASALNFGISSAIFVMLFGFWRYLAPSLRNGIVQRPGQSFSLKADFSAAIYAWVLSFPLVLSLNQLFEALVLKFFEQSSLPDQMAVRFLKATFSHGPSLFFAIMSIVVLAPLVEETLFRGFLQTFIRKHLGPKQAILITSVCFSFFHFSMQQGLGNIPIILSLFVLALFLGFTYEKRGSLLASMILHSAFNTVSVVNLYLFGGFTAGL